MPKVAAKKKCCKDKPRCSSCPVVLMRLERMGYAEAIPGAGEKAGKKKKKKYAVSKNLPKKAMLVARQR